MDRPSEEAWREDPKGEVMTKASILPGVLDEIAEVTDANTALQIADGFGGSRVQIPAFAKKEGHWLTDAIGFEKASAICDYFRIITGDGRAVGAYVEIPLGGRSRQEVIRCRIEALLKKGTSYDVIAREVGVSRMTVIRRKKALDSQSEPPDNGQLNLFGI